MKNKTVKMAVSRSSVNNNYTNDDQKLLIILICECSNKYSERLEWV